MNLHDVQVGEIMTADRITPAPIFNISEWDEVRVFKNTAYRFNWKTGAQ